MSECTVLDLKEKLDTEKINLIDVREYAEFANGRIIEAKHIPLEELGKLHKTADISESFYLISQTGKRSNEALDMLRVIGFTDLISVRGGIDAWIQAGFSIEKDENAPWEIDRQVSLIAGALVFFGVVFGLSIHWTFVLISAFTGIALMITAFTDSSFLGNLLLKMPWNQPKSRINDTA